MHFQLAFQTKDSQCFTNWRMVKNHTFRHKPPEKVHHDAVLGGIYTHQLLDAQHNTTHSIFLNCCARVNKAIGIMLRSTTDHPIIYLIYKSSVNTLYDVNMK